MVHDRQTDRSEVPKTVGIAFTPCKERQGHHVVGKVGAKPALTLRKQTLFKALLLKMLIKLTTTFIAIEVHCLLSVLFTFCLE